MASKSHANVRQSQVQWSEDTTQCRQNSLQPLMAEGYSSGGTIVFEQQRAAGT